MTFILLLSMLILIVGGLGVLIDSNRKITKIANKMEIFDIEDRRVSDDEIEKELEGDERID